MGFKSVDTNLTYDLRRNIAAAAVNTAFKGRKGHGGGPCTKRVLSADQLEDIVRGALLLFACKLHDRSEPLLGPDDEVKGHDKLVLNL